MHARLGVDLVAILLTAGMACAQTTHLVGPGGYPDIQSALAVESPGDVILVQPGTYDFFVANEGVTIRATVPLAASAAGAFLNIAQLPVGQTLHLVGMQLGGVSVTGGRVSLDDCLVDGPDGGGPLSMPSAGIELASARLRGSGLQVAGGAGVPLVPAIRADAASEVWLADSTLTADAFACALEATTGAHARCTFTPACATLPAGFVLGVSRPQPLQTGAPFTLEYREVPGTLVWLWADLTFAAGSSPLFAQPLLLPPTTAVPIGLLVTGLNGTVVGSWPIPATPGLVDRTARFQAFAGLTLPLPATALVGGVSR